MTWPRFVLVLASLVSCSITIASAQTTPAGLDSSTLSLAGSWSCAGSFSNGKPIEADVTFEPVLDGKWLLYRHTDRPPNRYSAIGLWRITSENKIGATIFDNFGGRREFTTDGWHSGSLTLESGDAQATRRERFVWIRQSEARLRMEYLVRRNGDDWKLGDSIDCRRADR